LIQRLTSLYELQLVDNLLDELAEQKGDLPLTLNELNGKIQIISDQIDAKETEKEECVEKRNENDTESVHLNDNLTKFKSQLYQVRNNKEYDALTKEIDNSEERISKIEDENKALQERIDQIKVELDDLKPEIDLLNEEKEVKETELKKIIKSNETEELDYDNTRKELAEKVRKNDYNTYMRIRKAMQGKAIVPVIRSACSGCFNVVPPQRQLEVKQNKRIFTCESCGRILVSAAVADEAEKKLS